MATTRASDAAAQAFPVGSEFMDRRRAYDYDPIGNRKTSSVWGGEPVAENVTTYTANNVNQYTSTMNPSESFTYDANGNVGQLLRS